jgi:hypothetical protein
MRHQMILCEIICLFVVIYEFLLQSFGNFCLVVDDICRLVHPQDFLITYLINHLFLFSFDQLQVVLEMFEVVVCFLVFEFDWEEHVKVVFNCLL